MATNPTPPGPSLNETLRADPHRHQPKGRAPKASGKKLPKPSTPLPSSDATLDRTRVSSQGGFNLPAPQTGKTAAHDTFPQGVSQTQDLGSISIEVSPSDATSKANPRINGFVRLIRDQDGGEAYELTADVFFRRQPYTMILYKTIDANEKKDDFDQAMKTLNGALLKILEKENIKANQSFNFLCTEEGIATYTPTENDDFDQNKDTIDSFLQRQKNVLVVKNDPAKFVSNLMYSRKTAEINAGLKAPLLKQYLAPPAAPDQTKPQDTGKPAAQPTQPPVGLQNLGNSCYFNAAFQAWATPAIRQEILTNPSVIQGGKSNPLYQALEAYDKAQKSDKPAPLDDTILKPLMAHLGLNSSVQEDADVAMIFLQTQLVPNEKSPLFCRIKTELQYTNPDTKKTETKLSQTITDSMLARKTITPSDKPFDELCDGFDQLDQHETVKTTITLPNGTTQSVPCTAKRESFETEPNVEYIHVKRTTFSSENLSKEQKDLLIEKLRSQKIAIPADEPSKDKLIQQRFALALGSVTAEEQQKFGSVPQIKNKTPLQNVPMKRGERALQGFILHLGSETNRGHYVYYGTDGKNYWIANDDKPSEVKPIDEEFNRALVQASGLIYAKNKAEIQTAASNDLLQQQTLFDQASTKVLVGVGSITQAPADAIVNFRPSHMTNKIVQVDKNNAINSADDMTDDRFDEVVQSENDWFNKYWRRRQRVLKFGEIVITPASKLNSNGIKHVVHAIIPAEVNADSIKNAVHTTLKKARKNKWKSIRFALPANLKTQDQFRTAYDAITDAIDSDAKENALKIDALKKIEIVLTQEQNDAIFPPPRTTPKVTPPAAATPTDPTATPSATPQQPQPPATATPNDSTAPPPPESTSTNTTPTDSTTLPPAPPELPKGAAPDVTAPPAATIPLSSVRLTEDEITDLFDPNVTKPLSTDNTIGLVATENDVGYVVEFSKTKKQPANKIEDNLEKLQKAIEKDLNEITVNDYPKGCIFDLRNGQISNAEKDIFQYEIGPDLKPEQILSTFLKTLKTIKNPQWKAIRIILPDPQGPESQELVNAVKDALISPSSDPSAPKNVVYWPRPPEQPKKSGWFWNPFGGS